MRQSQERSGSPVRIRIERLVLDGVHLAPGGAERVRRAVADELPRLLRAQPANALVGGAGAGVTGGARPRIDGGTVSWAPEHGADALGRQVAQALERGLQAGPAGGRGRSA